MNILAIGDVIGKPGRQTVQKLLPGLRKQYSLDLVMANAENAAGGLGLTINTAKELFDTGVDVLTSGNHIFDQKEIIPYLDGDLPILRPLNYPPGPPRIPGRGCLTRDHVAIVNLIGRTFMASYESPFRTIDQLLAGFKGKYSIVVVDFHAEATSEKMALGRYLDGRVSAIVGTHTHVGTIDAKVFTRGTAYVTDIGMVGPEDSIIGDDTQTVLNRFLTLMPHRLAVGSGEKNVFNSVLISVDDKSGKALSIERVDREVEIPWAK
jgi:metallophosphoesterase (TIGR00282 family)